MKIRVQEVYQEAFLRLKPVEEKKKGSNTGQKEKTISDAISTKPSHKDAGSSGANMALERYLNWDQKSRSIAHTSTSHWVKAAL